MPFLPKDSIDLPERMEEETESNLVNPSFYGKWWLK